MLKAIVTNDGSTLEAVKELPSGYDILSSERDAGFLEGTGSIAAIEFSNDGNKNIENMSLQIYTGETLLKTETITNAAPTESVYAESSFDLDEALLEINESVGTCQIEFRFYDGGTLHKTFLADY